MQTPLNTNGSWAFAEGMKLMEGNAKIIKFIAR
nr:MAG TPA: ribonucleotide-diphosphate reductase subunit beta [Caudoviricetes sp.]